jgi:hypothetical protein
MQEQLNQNLNNIGIWKRIFFILLFAVILKLAGLLLWLVVLLQIAAMLLTGRPMDNLLNFGRQLSGYLYQIYLFLTFSTDQMPFPFAAWNGTAAQQQDLSIKK